MGFSVKIKDDETKKIIKELGEAVDLALEECGSEAEGYAKMKCPVDTGLLHNSITYALHGKMANIKEYTADEPDESGNIKSGKYSGNADDDELCVYIGTNLEYGGYVEMGSSGRLEPRPFLKPAIEEHKEKYQKIFEKHMKESR